MGRGGGFSNRHTWGGVGRDEGDAVCGGGALRAGLDDEVLVGAGEAREPVQHLQKQPGSPNTEVTSRCPGLAPAEAGRGRVLHTHGDAGRGGRGQVDGEGHGAAEGGALVAEAEVAAAEHLVAAELLQRRRHRSIHAGASPSGTVRCGGDVEKGGREWRLALG